jgi:hypothetical protein
MERRLAGGETQDPASMVHFVNPAASGSMFVAHLCITDSGQVDGARKS